MELSESEDSEAEEAQTPGSAQTQRRRLRRAGERDVEMADAAAPAAAPAAFGVRSVATPTAAAAAAAPAEEWEVWEPAAEDSGEEWGGKGRRGRGRGRRGGRKKDRQADKEARRRAARQQQLPPRQRLAMRALAAAVAGVSAESTVAGVLEQAQRQAAEAHALLADAVPDALLVPADSPDAPPLGTAFCGAANGKAGGKPLGGAVAALLAARRRPALAALHVPTTAPAFEELPDLPQYRRNLESHCS